MTASLRLIACIAGVLLSLGIVAQNAFPVKELIQEELPNGVTYHKGTFVKAIQWKDSAGVNILLLTTAEKSVTKPETPGTNYKTIELFAHHYIQVNKSAVNDWKVYDREKECEFDVLAQFVSEATQVSDLDKDGIAEIWMLYRTSCRSDVSPEDMKLIMYEGKEKYALRGKTRVKTGENDYFGGNYTFDPAFKKGLETFRKYADQIWKKYYMP